MATPFNPLSTAFLRDPYPAYAALRRDHPVYRFEMLELWVLTRFDDCAAVLRDHASFSSSPHAAGGLIAQLQRQAEEEMAGPIAPTVLSSDPPVHTRLRSLVTKAFTPRRVEQMGAHVAAVADHLLAAVRPGEPFDLIREFAQPLPIIIIAELLGVPPSEREQFKAWSTVVAGMTSLIQSPDQNAVIATTRAEIRAYLTQVINARRAHPQDDLISALVQAQEAGESLDFEELLAFCVLLLVAGNETTANLIGNGTLALARHPEQASLLRAQPDLWPGAVEELARYDGPVQGTIRFARQETEIAGQRIDPGDVLFVGLGAANRDPTHFPNPDRLTIQREDNHHLAFGTGIHFCLGAPLARLETQIAFQALLARFPQLRVVEEPLEYDGTFILRGVKQLRILSAATT